MNCRDRCHYCSPSRRLYGRNEWSAFTYVSAPLSSFRTDHGLTWPFGISRQDVESRDDHCFFFRGRDIVQMWPWSFGGEGETTGASNDSTTRICPSLLMTTSAAPAALAARIARAISAWVTLAGRTRHRAHYVGSLSASRPALARSARRNAQYCVDRRNGSELFWMPTTNRFWMWNTLTEITRRFGLA